MIEYNGVVYGDTRKKWGEIDPVYPEKQQEYVPPSQCGNPHNYLNGWKCINCGEIAIPTKNKVGK